MAELNSRELKLLKLVCQDKNNSEIAAKLGISLRYTERLKARLHIKAKTRSNVGLLKWAVLNGQYVIKK